MLDLVGKFFGLNRKSQASKLAAKERLQFVLVQDKLNISPQNLELIKDDLLKVLAKYVEIDSRDVDVSLEKMDTSMAIIANIPVKSKKIK